MQYENPPRGAIDGGGVGLRSSPRLFGFALKFPAARELLQYDHDGGSSGVVKAPNVGNSES